MEQSPEMIGGAGGQTHLMRKFVSRHRSSTLLSLITSDLTHSQKQYIDIDISMDLYIYLKDYRAYWTRSS